MAIVPYRPVRGLEVSLNGDASLGDVELQDADLTQPGVVLRGPGARELAARVHQTGGTEALLPSTGGQALFYRPDVSGDELCLIHSDTLYSSKPTEVTVNGTQAWRHVGTWAPWTLRQSVVYQALRNVRAMDVATIRDVVTGKLYHVLTWQLGAGTGLYNQAANPGVLAMALDESGGVVAPLTVIAAGADQINPRACACNTGVVIAWANSTTGGYHASAWRLSNPVEFTAAVLIATVAVGNSNLHDMRKDGSNDRVIFAFADSVPATFAIGLRTITVSLVVAVVGAFVVVQAPSIGISVDVDPLGGYLITWASATNANAVHVTNAGVLDTVIATLATANPPLRITGCHVNGVASQGTVAVEQRIAATADFQSHVQVLSYNGAALASLRTQRGAILWGHALVHATRSLAWVRHVPDSTTGAQFSTMLLTDLLTGDVLGRAFPDRGWREDQIVSFSAQPMPVTPHVEGDNLWSGAVVVFETPLVGNNPADAIGVVRVASTSGPRNPATVPGYVMDAHAGFPVVYDGAEATEADWHVLPKIISVNPVAGGALVNGATYVIALTYKWVDRNGNIWRSAPAVTSRQVTGAGNQRLDLVVQTCRWTARDEVILEVWRSSANQGFPLYREPSQQTVNTPATDTITTLFVSIVDATAETREQLDQFAPAAVLGHGTTQVTDYMACVLGRFWAPDPERPDIQRHSIERDISRDGFGWGWEDTQILALDTSVRSQAAGDLEGNLAVLAGNECHLVYGLGPDKQGAGLFGQPSKFGVVDLETSQAKIARVPDSVVPGGLAYATPRGLYLLRRDRVSQALSTQVDRLFRFDGVAPQAIAYAPEYGEIFLMTLTSGRRSLRLSLLTGRWCADSARRAQDVAVSPRGEVAWLLPDSRTRILDDSLIADGGDQLVFTGTTPMLRLNAEAVGASASVQGLLLHTYLISGTAVLNLQVVDARTGEQVLAVASAPTYSVVGQESRGLPLLNRSTIGYRLQWTQPAGDAGKIAIVQIDSQVSPADGVLTRTPITL